LHDAGIVSDGASADRDRERPARGLRTEPDLGEEATAALARAIHAEGLDHPGPAALHSAWRRAALAEGVERAT
jgi:hypothetical protein